MNRGGIIFFVIVAAVGGAAGGYWYGRSPTVTRDSPPLAEATAAEAERNVLYYRDPSGAPYWSATPKKDDKGRDYLPVYDDEPSSAASKPAARSSSAGSKHNTVKVSLDRIQRSGVRIEKVQLRTVVRAIRAPGIVRINERKLSVVTLRAEGYIEELHVNTTGDTVKAGQPLFRLYSAPLVQAQLEYALAVKAARTMRDANQMAMVDGAAQKLRSLGMPEARIREIQESGRVSRTIEWPAPASGTVLEKKVISGQRIMPGDELYRIADLSTVWVIAEVAERDIGSIATGDRATVTFRAFSSQPMEGRVTLVYPELKPETRTARVRIELPKATATWRC